MHGYKPGRFSFNVKGGRCEACEGDGVRQIEMHFLADVFVPCEECQGKRFNEATLRVRYKGKSIADVLELTVREALELFARAPVDRAAARAARRGRASATCSSASRRRRSRAARRSASSSRASSRERATGRTLYILDEPTTACTSTTCGSCSTCSQRLVDAGNTRGRDRAQPRRDQDRRLGDRPRPRGRPRRRPDRRVGTPEQVATSDGFAHGTPSRGDLLRAPRRRRGRACVRARERRSARCRVGLARARGARRRDGELPPARRCSRTIRSAASASARRRRAARSTTRRTALTTRRSRSSSRSREECGVPRADRGDVPRRAHQHDREPRPCCTWRCARRGRERIVGRRARRRARRARGARAHARVRRRACARARGRATPGGASATSSTSASAARTSARAWSSRRCAARATARARRALRLQRRRDRPRRGDARPRPGRDAVHRLLEDVHDARDARQRARGARAGCVAALGDERRRRAPLRRRLDERRGGRRVRHRPGEHVRVLGLGRRALFAVVGDRARDRRSRSAGAASGAARRRARDGRALPHARRSSATCPCCWRCSASGKRSSSAPQTDRGAALRPVPRALARVPAAARHGEQRQARAARRAARRAADRADRLGRARHERPARVLPAPAPGHAARPVRLHRLLPLAEPARRRITTC